MNTLTRWLIAVLFALTTSAALAAPVQVLMKTNKGDIVLELNADKAPVSVANFLRYVDEGFYDGTIFHRVIKGFMAQAGFNGNPAVSKFWLQSRIPADPVKESKDYTVKAQSSAGSVENLRKVNKGRAHFGVVYSGHVYLGRNGCLDLEETTDPVVRLRVGPAQHHRRTRRRPCRARRGRSRRKGLHRRAAARRSAPRPRRRPGSARRDEPRGRSRCGCPGVFPGSGY